MKRPFLLVITSIFLFGMISVASAGEKLMVYTSMKESLIGSLRDAFAKKHPILPSTTTPPAPAS